MLLSLLTLLMSQLFVFFFFFYTGDPTKDMTDDSSGN